MDAVKCSLCGYGFDHMDTSCAMCPMSKGCRIVCCPRCGYQMVGSSRLLDILGNFWSGIKRKINCISWTRR